SAGKVATCSVSRSLRQPVLCWNCRSRPVTLARNRERSTIATVSTNVVPAQAIVSRLADGRLSPDPLWNGRRRNHLAVPTTASVIPAKEAVSKLPDGPSSHGPGVRRVQPKPLSSSRRRRLCQNRSSPVPTPWHETVNSLLALRRRRAAGKSVETSWRAHVPTRGRVALRSATATLHLPRHAGAGRDPSAWR